MRLLPPLMIERKERSIEAAEEADDSVGDDDVNKLTTDGAFAFYFVQ